MKLVSIAAQSAWSTLVICDRQARKDTAKLIVFITWLTNTLTSRQALQTYRAIWRVLVILAMVVVYFGLRFQQECDRFVAECETEPVVAVVEAIAPAPKPAKSKRRSSSATALQVARSLPLQPCRQGSRSVPAPTLQRG
jgi:hypothetical protein